MPPAASESPDSAAEAPDVAGIAGEAEPPKENDEFDMAAAINLQALVRLWSP